MDSSVVIVKYHLATQILWKESGTNSGRRYKGLLHYRHVLQLQIRYKRQAYHCSLNIQYDPPIFKLDLNSNCPRVHDTSMNSAVLTWLLY